MKKYLSPECELLNVTSKDDILFTSLTAAEEGEAPEVSYGDREKWIAVE